MFTIFSAVSMLASAHAKQVARLIGSLCLIAVVAAGPATQSVALPELDPGFERAFVDYLRDLTAASDRVDGATEAAKAKMIFIENASLDKQTRWYVVQQTFRLCVDQRRVNGAVVFDPANIASLIQADFRISPSLFADGLVDYLDHPVPEARSAALEMLLTSGFFAAGPPESPTSFPHVSQYLRNLPHRELEVRLRRLSSTMFALNPALAYGTIAPLYRSADDPDKLLEDFNLGRYVAWVAYTMSQRWDRDDDATIDPLAEVMLRDLARNERWYARAFVAAVIVKAPALTRQQPLSPLLNDKHPVVRALAERAERGREQIDADQ